MLTSIIISDLSHYPSITVLGEGERFSTLKTTLQRSERPTTELRMDGGCGCVLRPNGKATNCARRGARTVLLLLPIRSSLVLLPPVHGVLQLYLGFHDLREGYQNYAQYILN